MASVCSMQTAPFISTFARPIRESLSVGSTDAELVGALRVGHPNAAGMIYRRHSQAVQRLTRRLLGSDAEAADVVQEVFERAFSAIHTLRHEGALKSWILGIAAGECRSQIRRRTGKRLLAFLPPSDIPELPIIQDLAHREPLRQVVDILDRLPACERSALVLHRIEGFTLVEAAGACGMSLTTFKRRLARAESRFFARAARAPALAEWLSDTSRDGALAQA
jgi:RNA polymerase sigma-70 factor (ECF subfamily)